VYDWRTKRHVARMASASVAHELERFDYERFRSRVLVFLQQMRIANSDVEYRFSQGQPNPTLYASAYACMTYSLLGVMQRLSQSVKNTWLQYFDALQNQEDGLFYDPRVKSKDFSSSDWWGARHLALHMISAYTVLGGRPRQPFHFLKAYYDQRFLEEWLDSVDWNSAFPHSNDIDNKIMNIGGLLQYQRDFWQDDKAASAVSFLIDYLIDKINPETGLWGTYKSNDAVERSRMVQFAYHILMIFFYDGHFNIEHQKIIAHTLRTQNDLGGFGVKLNSSACEDIDSIDLLIRLSPYVEVESQSLTRAALTKAFGWILQNQMPDGGFTFRLGESLNFGSTETSSARDHGALLPTWFRTLSLAYLAKFHGARSEFVITRCPGYEF
jgi:hypothetical protein